MQAFFRERMRHCMKLLHEIALLHENNDSLLLFSFVEYCCVSRDLISTKIGTKKYKKMK